MGVYFYGSYHFAHAQDIHDLGLHIGSGSGLPAHPLDDGGELVSGATVVSTCLLLLAWIQSLSDMYFIALASIGVSYLL